MSQYRTGGSVVPGNGGGTIKIDYAIGDREAGGVTPTNTNLTFNGGTQASLLKEAEQAFFSAVAVDGTRSMTWSFDTTVELQAVTWEQNVSTNNGTWALEVLRFAVWESASANIVLGGVTQAEYPIDADVQADVDGVRMVGVSGNTSSTPFLTEIRFWALE